MFDPFPNAIIEAASVGLPTVAIDNGSRREAVVDGVTGRLAAASPESVADALSELLEDPERCRLQGQAARDYAEAHFTWDRVVDKVMATVRWGSSAVATVGVDPAVTAGAPAVLAVN